MSHYGAKNGPIWPIIKLVWDFVQIKIPVKFERNPVKSVACIAFTTMRDARPPARENNTKISRVGDNRFLTGKNSYFTVKIACFLTWIIFIIDNYSCNCKENTANCAFNWNYQLSPNLNFTWTVCSASYIHNSSEKNSRWIYSL